MKPSAGSIVLDTMLSLSGATATHDRRVGHPLVAAHRLFKRLTGWISWPVLFASCCALVYAAWAQLSLQLLHRFRFPYRDFVAVTESLDRLHISALTPWKGPSIGQHRIIYPNILYVLDNAHFGASGTLLYPFIYAFTILSAVLLVVPAAAVLRKQQASLARYLIGLLFASSAIYWFCSAYNWENLTFQIQLCETACIVFITFGLLAASQVSVQSKRKESSTRDIFCAGIAGTSCHIATFSWGAGLVCWPILLAHAIFYRWRRAPVLVIAMIGALTIAGFSYSYLAGHADYDSSTFYQSFGSGIRNPLKLLYFVLNVIAWPPSLAFGDFVPQRESRLISLVLALMIGVPALMAMGRSYLQRDATSADPVRRHAVFFTMIVAASVCSAALAGVTRDGALTGWGQSRYGVFSAMFWLGLAGWSVCTSKRPLRPLSGLAGITLLIAFVPWKYYELDIRSREQGLYQAGALATLGISSEDLPSLNAGPHVEMWKRPRGSWPSLARREPFRWFGQPIASVGYSPIAGACAGDVESTTAVNNSSKIFIVGGWAADSANNAPLNWVLIADRQGTVVGGGKPGLPSYDLVRRFNDSKPGSSPLAGIGYARFSVVALGGQSEQFSLWGILSNGDRCEIAAREQRHDRYCDKNCGFDQWYGIGLPQ